MKKKNSLIFSIIVVLFIGLVFVDYNYVGIYRNSDVVDITITSDSIHNGTIYRDTLYRFESLQPGQVKFSFKDKRLELFDVESDTAFYKKLLFNLDDRASRITIDEYKDGRISERETVAL
ncbi:MAG TPA: hypothetical protein VGQ59_11845 [Cyclobacteriaceae bacterium]|jgi:hypothetical protein|nr:hypothetical protein [Cyclobacteriaceae bacterium]